MVPAGARPSSPGWARLTALYAALCAVTQRDIKKVLAYSTLSQLGYMVAAFGLGLRPGARDVPPDDARLLQGAPLPRLRLGHPRLPPRAGHLQDGRAAEADAAHLLAPSRSPWPRSSAFPASRASSRRTRSSPWPTQGTARSSPSSPSPRSSPPSTWCASGRSSSSAQPRSEAAGHAHEGGLSSRRRSSSSPSSRSSGGYWRRSTRGRSTGILSLIPEAEGATHAVVLGDEPRRARSLGAGAGARVLRRRTGRDALEREVPGRLRASCRRCRTSFDTAYDYYVAKVQQRVAMVLNFIDVVGLAGRGRPRARRALVGARRLRASARCTRAASATTSTGSSAASSSSGPSPPASSDHTR